MTVEAYVKTFGYTIFQYHLTSPVTKVLDPELSKQVDKPFQMNKNLVFYEVDLMADIYTEDSLFSVTVIQSGNLVRPTRLDQFEMSRINCTLFSPSEGIISSVYRYNPSTN